MAGCPVVVAAGGVLWRGEGADTEIAIVHRPRYDDWSVPKGKRKTAEPLLLTALREVEEETGHRPTLGPYLARFSYLTSSGGRPARKDVAYWSMSAGSGTFAPNEEVDEVRWMSVAAATSTVESAVDRRLLRLFAATPRTAQPLLVIRGGGNPDPQLLASAVTGMGITELRCGTGRAARTTLGLVAAATGLPLILDPAWVNDPAQVPVTDRPGGTAVCLGQTDAGNLLAALERWYGGEPVTTLPAGGWQLLQFADGRLLPGTAAGASAA